MSAGSGHPDPKSLINSLKKVIDKNTLIFEATYKAYTPWAGGCAENATILVKDNRVIDVCLPDAKGLIGRARWLGRIAVATALGKNIDMKLAEVPIGEVLGSTSASSPVRAIVKPLNKSELISLLDKAYRNAQEIIYKNKDDPKKAIIQSIALYSSDQPYRIMLKNTRIKLALINKNEPKEIVSKMPLPPKHVRFKLIIYSRIWDKNDPRVKAATALLAATPLLAGLGSMVTRGFGRFCIEEEKYLAFKDNNKDNIVKEIINSVKCDRWRVLTEARKEHLNQEIALLIKDSIINIYKNIGELLLKLVDDEKLKELRESSGYTPIIDESLSTVINLKTNNIYKIINKIGFASTKSCWKDIANFSRTKIKSVDPECRDVMVPKSGACLHTWPLGLPRLQESGGYILINPANIKTKIKINQETDDNTEEMFCSTQSPRMLSKQKLGKAGRRLSSIHIFPLPPFNDYVPVAIITYNSKDFIKIISGLPAKDKELELLYHVGRYALYVYSEKEFKSYRKKSRKFKCKIKFSDFHYVSILKLAKKTNKNVIIDPCSWEKDLKERGGICIYEDGKLRYRYVYNPEELIKEALKAAFNFMLVCLKSSSNYSG